MREGERHPDLLPLGAAVTVATGGKTIAAETYQSLRVGGYARSSLTFELATFPAEQGHKYLVSLTIQSGTPVACDAWLDVSLAPRVRENLLFQNAGCSILAFIPLIAAAAFFLAALVSWRRRVRTMKPEQ